MVVTDKSQNAQRLRSKPSTTSMRQTGNSEIDKSPSANRPVRGDTSRANVAKYSSQEFSIAAETNEQSPE